MTIMTQKEQQQFAAALRTYSHFANLIRRVIAAPHDRTLLPEARAIWYRHIDWLNSLLDDSDSLL